MFNKTIDKLYAGVSQQPFNERLDAHTEEQINVINDVVKGSYKRPPSNFISNVTVNELSYSNVIQVNEKKYILTLDTDKFEPLKIHDLNGNKKKVVYDSQDSLDYINDNNVVYSKNYRHEIDFKKQGDTVFNWATLQLDDIKIENNNTNVSIDDLFNFFVDYINDNLPQYNLLNVDYNNYTFQIDKRNNGSIINNFGLIYLGFSNQKIIYGEIAIYGELNSDVKNLKEIYKTVDIKDNIILVNKNVKVESVKNKNDLEKETVTQITPYYYNIDFADIHDTISDWAYDRRLTIKLEGRTFTTRTKTTKNLIQRIVSIINNSKIYEAEYADYSGLIVRKKNGGKINNIKGLLYYNDDGSVIGDGNYTREVEIANITESGGEIIVDPKKFYNFVEIVKSVNNTKYYVNVEDNIGHSWSFNITANGDNIYTTAADLANAINNNSSVIGAIAKNQYILIYFENDKTPFTISTKSDSGNENIKTIGNVINSFSKLPVDGFFENYILKIENDPENKYDNYYTVFQNGHWREWCNVNIDNDIADNTLPRVIVYDEENDLFEVSFLDIEPRLVGDETSAPMPSFVENKIVDLIVFKNRLGILSDKGISFSNSDNYYSFFPKTVKRITAEDPIDLSVSINEKVNMKYAVSFEDKLILFSKDRQFILEGSGNEITLTNVSITPITKNTINDYIYPIALENSLYYTINNNKYANVVEYNVYDSDKKNTDNITTHIPEYIPNEVSKMVGDGNKNKLFLTHEGFSDLIYMYSGFITGNQKIQEAWTKLKLDNCDFIKNIEYFDNKLYLILSRKTGNNIINYLEYIDLEYNNANEDLICLDSKIYCKECSNTNFGKKLTKTDNSYGIYPGVYTVYYINWEKYTSNIYGDNIRYDVLLTDNVTGKQDILKNGQVIMSEVTTDDGSILTGNLLYIPGDYSGYLVNPIVGVLYNMEYKLSPMILRDYNGKVDNTSKVKIKDINFRYYDTRYIKTEIQQKGRSVKEKEKIFEEKQEGNFKSLVMSDKNTVSIKLTNNSVWQTFINAIDFRGIISKTQ